MRSCLSSRCAALIGSRTSGTRGVRRPRWCHERYRCLSRSCRPYTRRRQRLGRVVIAVVAAVVVVVVLVVCFPGIDDLVQDVDDLIVDLLSVDTEVIYSDTDDDDNTDEPRKDR